MLKPVWYDQHWTVAWGVLLSRDGEAEQDVVRLRK